MKKGSARLIFASVNKARTGTYTCKMENTKNMSENRHSKWNKCGTVSHPEESVIPVECRFRICLENLMVPVKWYKPAGCGPGAPQTNVTEKETWTGLSFLPCVIFGLAVGTLLYMPIICLLLWQCRRNRKGKLTSRQVAEGNQLSTASPVTGTEDLTYVNLEFEKKGTNPTSSDVVYTEIKALQQKQSSRDAGAANAGVDVSPEGEGK
ncbi:PREDICTED: uncharacterized protein LOC109279826 [Aptenodytes forsteri]|uniref:uncharacterized protein LOC109279826 n=1 Tax=Aptenodytes forsteri TaxID=9233 RepID=UPI000905A592|nr:PREDICTED: uncharacterized protein LOC109279826 [Aptenodytes forsteri]